MSTQFCSPYLKKDIIGLNRRYTGTESVPRDGPASVWRKLNEVELLFGKRWFKKKILKGL